MKITPYTKAKNKEKLDYYLFETQSDDVMICFHGLGERAVKKNSLGKEVAVTDGSMLQLVLNHGYPMHAANGFEFTWNIIAPQFGIDYNSLIKNILPWVRTKYPKGKIFVTGLSFGGMATEDILKKLGAEMITAAAPVCGRSNAGTAATCVDLPIQLWHGDQDHDVEYSLDMNFVKAYNKSHTNQIDLVVMKGYGHNIWDAAYSVAPGKDKLLQWFKSHQ